MTWLYVPPTLPGTPSPCAPAAAGSTSASSSPCPERTASVTWRGKPMPPHAWSRAWKRATWLRRLSGLTSPPSTLDHGAAAFIASLPEIPARTTSTAGKQLGAGGTRFLIPEVLRVVDQCRPLRLFRENVPGNAAGQLAALVPPLERMGYRVECGLFSSAETGASHGRKRMFVMADLADAEGERPGEAWELRHQQPEEWPAGCGCLVGHADCEPEGAGAAGCAPRGTAGEPGGSVADAGGARRGAGRVQQSRCEGGQALAAVGSGELANAGGAGSQGRELDRACDDERHGPHAHGPVAEFRPLCLPLSAPGPSDSRWPAILAAAPQLEPAVCRMAHALAHRVERLGLLGNGVDPVAAAYAWLCLDARHRAARAARPAGPGAVKAA